MKKEFVGILQTSFGMMGTVHLCLKMPGSLGDTNQFLEEAIGKPVLVTVETQEAAA